MSRDVLSDGSVGDDPAPPALGVIMMPRERFFSPDAEDGLCPAVIDATGLARFLFFGPYLELDAGVWRATASVTLCADAARCRLALQFGVEPDYTTLDLQFGQPGTHTVQILHTVDVPGLAQVRLWLKRPAFHGYVRFESVALDRPGVPTSEPLS